MVLALAPCPLPLSFSNATIRIKVPVRHGTIQSDCPEMGLIGGDTLSRDEIERLYHFSSVGDLDDLRHNWTMASALAVQYLQDTHSKSR